MPGLLLATVDLRHLDPGAIRAINVVIAVDAQASEAIQTFAELQERSSPVPMPDGLAPDELALGQGVIWNVARDGQLVHFYAAPCRSRHRRK
jgi:hypothetical protein